MQKITLDIQHSKAKHAPRIPLRIPPKEAKKKDSLIPKSSKPGKNRKRFLFAFLGLLLIGAGVIGYFAYRGNKALNFMGINTNPSTTITNIIKQKDPELKKDDQNRTNALIVGIDTRPTDRGLQNTDTIMVASFNHTTNDTILISIPRDILVGYPDNPYYFTKINAIYNYCERQNSGTGLECLSQTAGSITGLTIQYYVMVDIAGMVEIIDILGGIDVDVERAFTDYMFPTVQNTYEVIHFDEGLQHMDGETAMKYARSRHAQSIEGSDYSRARRQQKVVVAAIDKALTQETLQNPLSIIEIIEELGKSITISEITTEDIRAGLILAEKIQDDQVYNVVLDPTLANWQLIGENPAGPKAGLGVWDSVTEYLTILYAHPALYTSDKDVYVYNAGLGYNETYQEYIRITEAFPYLSIVFGGNSAIQTLTGTHVYNFDTELSIPVLNEYADFFQTEWTSTLPEGLTNVYHENIAILCGAPVPETVPNATETPVTE